MSTIETCTTVTAALTSQIISDRQRLVSESWHPGFSADESDSLIKHLTQRIEKLRALRNQIEDVLTEIPQ